MFLAQANIALFRWPLDDDRMRAFEQQIQPVNQLAADADGFVWRFTDSLQPNENAAPWNDPLLFFNMSVWRDLASLLGFVRLPEHISVMQERQQWIKPVNGPSLVLWWIEEHHTPIFDDAVRAFASLAENGNTPDAFSIDSKFAMGQ